MAASGLITLAPLSLCLHTQFSDYQFILMNFHVYLLTYIKPGFRQPLGVQVYLRFAYVLSISPAVGAITTYFHETMTFRLLPELAPPLQLQLSLFSWIPVLPFIVLRFIDLIVLW